MDKYDPNVTILFRQSGTKNIQPALGKRIQNYGMSVTKKLKKRKEIIEACEAGVLQSLNYRF